jgi:phosphoglycerate kinase
MRKRSVRDVEVGGRTVLVRVDHNVPLDDHGNVADDRRMVESLPTIQYLLEREARVVLLSHLGRPGGRRSPGLSLAPVAERMSQLLGRAVPLAPETVGAGAMEAVRALPPGGVLYLENLRFHPGEEANDPAFASELARLGDLFVEEAFGTVHRAHASTVGLPRRLPSCAGFLVERELLELGRLLEAPPRPFVVVLGGAKVDDKLPLVRHLRTLAQEILLGGALALPLLRPPPPGAPPRDPGIEELLHQRPGEARVVLPVDFLVEEPGSAAVRTVNARPLPPELRPLDVGPETRRLFASRLAEAGTVFFNGPLGKVEDSRFAGGTREVLSALRPLTGPRVAAGGDSSRALQDLGLEDCFSYVSTGGGAALELLEGQELPGLTVLPDA